VVFDYVGVWNERAYNSTYIKLLRQQLNVNGFMDTQIVADDAWYSDGFVQVSDRNLSDTWTLSTVYICVFFSFFFKDMQQDPELFAAVSVVGVHYPGTYSPATAVALGKPLWASEDYSTFADEVGGGCWSVSCFLLFDGK
jgi:galactosylceramidase